MLGLAHELGAQLRILRGDAHRTRVQVTLAHHDAAERDERRRCEAELVGAQHGRHDHVETGAQLAVRLQNDTRTQVVEHQRLMRLGYAELPRKTGALDASPATR